MKTGLVLGGGGANGAYEAGAVLALAEAGWSFDWIGGISVGSIGTGGLAQFPKARFLDAAHYLCETWRAVKGDADVYKWRQPKYVAGLVSPSLATSEALDSFLRKHVEQHKIETSGVEWCIPAVDLLSGDNVVFQGGPGRRHDDIQLAMRASACFPIAFAPIDVLDDKPGKALYLTDAGIRDVVPLSRAIDAGCDKVAVIVTQTDKVERVERKDVDRTLESAHRMFEIMVHEIVNGDIAMFEQINRWMAQGIVLPGKRPIDGTIIRPTTPLGDSLSFTPEKNETLIARGYADAKAAL